MNTDGVIRYEHPSNFQNSGRVMTGQLDGQRVSTFSGGKPPAASSVPLPGKKSMIRFLLLCLLSFSAIAADKQAPYQFDLTGLPIGQVAQIFYADAFRKPYILSPEVLEDGRPVSLRVQGSAVQVRAISSVFLMPFGYAVTQRNGVDHVMPKKEPAPPPGEYFLYRPLYRDVAYLSETLAPLFQGKFGVDRGISVPGQTPMTGSAPRGSAASLLNRDADQLVFVGTKAEIANLRSLLPQVDIEMGEVMLRSAVYEVQTGDRDGSAFSLAASLLKGKVSINLAGNPLDNSVSISTGDFNAVLSALSSDSRFKVSVSRVCVCDQVKKRR
ncbi:hypothetical protein [Pseudomonas frederiksbergensis]|uniref:hypothetical protein n=1 Tax=Pseudomonas frederiksbergensis TaxID=104087 RepID=UPI00101AE59F|nr:hypothetical protein [Pseudomonas frederiksbergensis]